MAFLSPPDLQGRISRVDLVRNATVWWTYVAMYGLFAGMCVGIALLWPDTYPAAHLWPFAGVLALVALVAAATSPPAIDHWRNHAAIFTIPACTALGVVAFSPAGVPRCWCSASAASSPSRPPRPRVRSSAPERAARPTPGPLVPTGPAVAATESTRLSRYELATNRAIWLATGGMVAFYAALVAGCAAW